MAETGNRLSSPNSGAKTAPVTASTTPNLTARKRGREKGSGQDKLMETEAPEVAALPNNRTKQVTCEAELIPTLRLRLEELRNEAQAESEAETAASSGTKAATSRSKSPSRKPRQAVTKPRRKQPHVAATSATESATPTESFSTELTAKMSQESQMYRLTFDDWLLLKAKQDAQRRRDDRRELTRLSQMQQMRQQLSDQCYVEWLRSKRRRSCPTNTNSNINSTSSNNNDMNAMLQAQQMAVSRGGMPTMLVEAARRRAEQTKHTVQQWERRKLLERQRQRERQLRERNEQQVRDHLRRQLSQLAWHRWLQQQDKQQQQQQQQQDKQQHLKQRRHRPQFSSNLSSTLAAMTLQRQLLQQQQQRRPASSSSSPSSSPQRRSSCKKPLPAIESLYLHVPLSAAQHSLRQRLDSIDGLNMQRQRRR